MPAEHPENNERPLYEHPLKGSIDQMTMRASLEKIEREITGLYEF